LGTRLLFALSKSSPRLHQSVVERGELGRSGEELLSLVSVAAVYHRRYD